jgi:hypothetical protein
LAGSSRFCAGTATSTPSGISIFGSVVVVGAGSVGGGVGAALVGAALVGAALVGGLASGALVGGAVAGVVLFVVDTVVVTAVSAADSGTGESSAQPAIAGARSRIASRRREATS